MKISNPRSETLQQLFPRVQQHFPEAAIRKPFLGPEAIFIPYSNYKFVVRNKGNTLKIDHTLPVIYVIGAIVVSFVLISIIMSIIYGQLMIGFGGALWIILGVLIMKQLFQTIKKAEFTNFQVELTDTVNQWDQTSSSATEKFTITS